jgi:hypothetical protein
MPKDHVKGTSNRSQTTDLTKVRSTPYHPGSLRQLEF